MLRARITFDVDLDGQLPDARRLAQAGGIVVTVGMPWGWFDLNCGGEAVIIGEGTLISVEDRTFVVGPDRVCRRCFVTNCIEGEVHKCPEVR